MERDQIVELIKGGRLQEAIKALDKAAKNTHLQNDVINLSAAYADYVKHNRTATEDFETLNIQRSKITNSLLSILDELSPEALAAAEADSSYTVTSVTYSKVFSKNASKVILIGAGVVALLAIIIVFSLSSGSNVDNTIPPIESQPNNDLTNGVSLVKYIVNNGVEGSFVRKDDHWVENDTDSYTEDKRENNIIYLHNDNNGVSVEMDLFKKQIWVSSNQDPTLKFFSSIDHFE